MSLRVLSTFILAISFNVFADTGEAGLCEHADTMKTASAQLKDIQKQFTTTEQDLMKCGRDENGIYKRYNGYGCRYYDGAGLSPIASIGVGTAAAFAACRVIGNVGANRLGLGKAFKYDFGRFICPFLGMAPAVLATTEGSTKAGVAFEELIQKQSSYHLLAMGDIKKELKEYRQELARELAEQKSSINSLKKLKKTDPKYKKQKDKIGKQLAHNEIGIRATIAVLSEVVTECNKPAEALGSVGTVNAPVQALN